MTVVRGCPPTVSSPSMNAHPPRARRGLFGHPLLTVTIVVAALLGAGVAGVALANRGESDPATWHAASPASAAPREEKAEVRSIRMSATGDIIMGSAPNRLPANGGE